MKYIKFLSLLILLAVAPGLKAITAAEVVDKVVANMQSAPSINVKMTMQTGRQTVNGDLTIAREKFKYGAGSIAVFYDGSTQWTVDHGSKEISLNNPTASELSEVNPLAFMQSYKKNYSVAMVSQSGGTYVIKMTANRKSAYVRTAQVTVNASTWMPTQIVASLANGQNMTIRINSATKGKSLGIDSFRYNPKSNPSYEVIDLR